jgi:hypothetical protein
LAVALVWRSAKGSRARNEAPPNGGEMKRTLYVRSSLATDRKDWYD